LRVPAGLGRFIATKGSVALDGGSLTVNEGAGETFSVLIIPHTLKATTLGRVGPRGAGNLQGDLMARYAARVMERSQSGARAHMLPTRSAWYDHPDTGDEVMAEPRGSAAKETPDRESSDLEGARILVVEARFYEDIADALLAGATRALQEAGVVFERVSVPGSLEVAPAIAIALDAAEHSGRPYEGAV